MLIEYVKNKENQKIGCLVAKKDIQSKRVYIGWSKYNSKLEKDNFDKQFAVHLAAARINKKIKVDNEIMHHTQALIELSNIKKIEIDYANSEEAKEKQIPFAIMNVISKFYDRCCRYYKTINIEIV